MHKIGIVIGLLILGIGCKNPSNSPIAPIKKVALNAVHESGDLVEYRHELTVFTDSTFVYDAKEKDHGHSKYEKFEGQAYIRHDTLYFSRNDMNGLGNKAVLKNHMLEFADEGKIFRLEIAENNTTLKSAIDLTAYKDYAVFSYFPTKKSDPIQPYTINQSQLEYAIDCIACVFDENKEKLKPESEYVKQLIPYQNRNGALEIRVYLISKNKMDPKAFKYRPTRSTESGICTISFVISFAANYYSDLSMNSACNY